MSTSSTLPAVSGTPVDVDPAGAPDDGTVLTHRRV